MDQVSLRCVRVLHELKPGLLARSHVALAARLGSAVVPQGWLAGSRGSHTSPPKVLPMSIDVHSFSREERAGEGYGTGRSQIYCPRAEALSHPCWHRREEVPEGTRFACF